MSEMTDRGSSNSVIAKTQGRVTHREAVYLVYGIIRSEKSHHFYWITNNPSDSYMAGSVCRRMNNKTD